jgi:hypothetical protein
MASFKGSMCIGRARERGLVAAGVPHAASKDRGDDDIRRGDAQKHRRPGLRLPVSAKRRRRARAAMAGMLSSGLDLPPLNQFEREHVGVAPMAPRAAALRGRLSAVGWGVLRNR